VKFIKFCFRFILIVLFIFASTNATNGQQTFEGLKLEIKFYPPNIPINNKDKK